MCQTKYLQSGCYDINGDELQVGQTVLFQGQQGMVSFEMGAYGITFETPVDWEAVKQECRIGALSRLNNWFAIYKDDHFITFREIIWYFGAINDRISVVRILKNVAQP